MANQALGAPRLTGPQPVARREVASSSGAQGEPLLQAGNSQVADGIFHFAMLACGFCVLALVGLIIYELISGSKLSWHAFGLKFFFQSEWDPVNEQFGALPFVYGTLVSSAIALIIAVPLSIATAVYLTEIAPRWIGTTITLLVQLLAAVPSVILGLWGIFVMVPWLRERLFPLLRGVLGFLPFFSGPIYGVS